MLNKPRHDAPPADAEQTDPRGRAVAAAFNASACVAVVVIVVVVIIVVVAGKYAVGGGPPLRLGRRRRLLLLLRREQQPKAAATRPGVSESARGRGGERDDTARGVQWPFGFCAPCLARNGRASAVRQSAGLLPRRTPSRKATKAVFHHGTVP